MADNQRQIIGRLRELVVGLNLMHFAVLLKITFRPVVVGIGQRGTNVF